MKWFKHDTDSDESEGLDKLIQEFGFEGYGRWFRLLEIVAKKMEHGSDRCHVEYTEAKWCSYLLVRRPLFRRYLVVISQLFDIKVITTGLLIRIEIPNLLNKRDNWTRRSVVTTEKLPPKIKEVRSKIKEKDKKTSRKFCEFQTAWESYPKKDGRKQAEVSYRASINNQEDHERLMVAMEKYKKSVCDDPRPWKNGSTFFNNWLDWYDWKEPENIERSNGSGNGSWNKAKSRLSTDPEHRERMKQFCDEEES